MNDELRAGNPSPDQEGLELERKRLELEKLRREVKQPSLLADWAVRAGSLSAMVAVLSATVGFVITSVNSCDQHRAAQEEQAGKERDALNSILDKATDGKATAQRRATFVAALRPYWRSPYYELVASALAAMILNDPDMSVVRACSEVFGDAYLNDPDRNRALAIKKYLFGTQWGDIGVVPRCQKDLYDRKQSSGTEQQDKLFTERINATKEAVRKNWYDLENVNLRSMHLEDAELWRADLSGALVNDAFLDGADLFEAKLEGTLMGNTSLEGANVKGTLYAPVSEAGRKKFGYRGTPIEMDKEAWWRKKGILPPQSP